MSNNTTTTSNNNNNNNHKKRNAEMQDFDTVRQYLLQCPLVSHNPAEQNPAIKAALQGLSTELQRRERDAKLQKKFSGNHSNNNNNTSAREEEEEDWQAVEEPSPTISDERRPSPTNMNMDEVEIVDKTTTMESDGSYLGQTLAEVAIAQIASANATAKTPLSAIALVLHAALRSDLLQFACTGTSSDHPGGAKASGFAAPIRELPKTQFLPKEWEKDSAGNKGTIRLRYRKAPMGTVFLKLTLTKEENQDIVQVQVVPANAKECPSLKFPLSKHINLDSWNAALKTSTTGSLPPALHYKQLTLLLTEFVTTFDLGPIADANMANVDDGNDNGTTPQALPKMAFAPSCRPDSTSQTTNPSPSSPIMVYNPHQPPTVGTAFPPPITNGPRGDFYNDIAPAGGNALDPLRRTDPVGQPGNLMGPNHPLFAGNFPGSGIPRGGPGSMMPRFDPFGPPGGPQEITDPNNNPNNNNNNGRPNFRRPGGSGEPNPDHLRPPNSLGNNNSHMFM